MSIPIRIKFLYKLITDAKFREFVRMKTTILRMRISLADLGVNANDITDEELVEGCIKTGEVLRKAMLTVAEVGRAFSILAECIIKEKSE